MGYRRQQKTYKLIFETADMAGLEVRATSVPIGQFMGIVNLAKLKEASDAGKLKVDDLGAFDDLIGGFAKALKSWNVEDDDGAPVPATYDGLMAQDIDFVFAIIFAWLDAIAGVPGPLEQRSSGGEQSLEGSMPMAVLSSSPPT